DGIARKSVDHQDVIVRRLLFFHRKARVAHQDFLIACAMAKESKLPAFGERFNQRIDFVDSYVIAGTAVSGHDACPHTDYAVADGSQGLLSAHGAADARARCV